VTKEGQASYAHVHEIIDGLKKLGWSVKLFQPSFKTDDVTNRSALSRLLGFVATQLTLLFSQSFIHSKIVYVRFHFAAFPVVLLAKLCGHKVVQEVNGPYEDLFIAWPFTRRFRSLFCWLIRIQLQLADLIITATPQLKEWVMKESKNEKVFVIPNGANVSLFVPKASADEPADKYVIFFGALAAWQGLDVVLQAVKLTNWPSAIKLKIVGDGQLAYSVKQAASEMPERIDYLGKLPYQQLPSVINKSLASLVSSQDRESTGLFPLKLFESMACGVPVIVLTTGQNFVEAD